MKPMSPSVFVGLQTLATVSLTGAVALLQAAHYLEAGVCGLMGMLAYLLYEYLPAKDEGTL